MDRVGRGVRDGNGFAYYMVQGRQSLGFGLLDCYIPLSVFVLLDVSQ